MIVSTRAYFLGVRSFQKKDKTGKYDVAVLLPVEERDGAEVPSLRVVIAFLGKVPSSVLSDHNLMSLATFRLGLRQSSDGRVSYSLVDYDFTA